MTLQIGDKVWFKSKFGDRVTGVFVERSTTPAIRGGKVVDVPTCIVDSYDAFGKVSKTATRCSVSEKSLNKLED